MVPINLSWHLMKPLWSSVSICPVSIASLCVPALGTYITSPTRHQETATSLPLKRLPWGFHYRPSGCHQVLSAGNFSKPIWTSLLQVSLEPK